MKVIRTFAKKETWDFLSQLIPTIIAIVLISEHYMSGTDSTKWIKGFLIWSTMGSTWIAQAIYDRTPWKRRWFAILVGIPFLWLAALFALRNWALSN